MKSILTAALAASFACTQLVGVAWTQERKTIGWAVATMDHPVYQLMMQAGKDLAAKSDCDLVFADGKNDPAAQTAQIENFIAQGVDGIVLSPSVADPLIPAVKKINAAGVPLVLADRRMQTRGQGIKWDALVSWDMVKSGVIGGEQTVEALNGKGNVVVVEGTPGVSTTLDRGDAYYGVLAKYPDIKVIDKVNGEYNRAKAQEVTENILQKYKAGEIDAIYYMNDEMLFGGIQAIKSTNRLGEFKIISVDGDKNALNMVRAKEVDYEALFHPDDQSVAVTILCDIIHGRDPKLAEQSYSGRKMDLVEFEGMPWVRPTVFPVDQTNAHLPENQGW